MGRRLFVADLAVDRIVEIRLRCMICQGFMTADTLSGMGPLGRTIIPVAFHALMGLAGGVVGAVFWVAIR